MLAIQSELNKLRQIEDCKQLQSLETMSKLNEKPKLEAELEELAIDAAEWFGGNATRLQELKTGVRADGKSLFLSLSLIHILLNHLEIFLS